MRDLTEGAYPARQNTEAGDCRDLLDRRSRHRSFPARRGFWPVSDGFSGRPGLGKANAFRHMPIRTVFQAVFKP
jgi:hypothetical protein